MGEVMAEIAAASEKQSQGVVQIDSAVGQLNQVTQQTAAGAEQSASVAEELASQAREMRALANAYKISGRDARRQMTSPTRSPELALISL
jgi:methyl-accepting chemotaxis protein